MKVHNIRLGFATNSSSTHSLVFLDKVHDSGDGQDFGWDNFTVGSPERKLSYFGQILKHGLTDAGIPDNIARETAERWAGAPVDEGGYIDHQSVPVLPRTWDGKSVNVAFANNLKAYLLRDGLHILGGNDNDDSAHYLRNDTAHDLPLQYDGSAHYVARKDGNQWTLFDRYNGAKIRMTFEGDKARTVEPVRPNAPELVDVKITDFCTFNCSYCYQGSTEKGQHADKHELETLAYNLGQAEVFEVAIGGGEPTLHPDFVSILGTFQYAGVTANFTTRNLQWLKDEEKRAKILDRCGAFAFSADDANKVRAFLSLVDVLNVKREKVAVQYVIGSASQCTFESIIKLCDAHDVRLILLGFKTNGRGAKAYRYDNEWIEKLRRGWVGVDTAIIQEHEAALKARGVQAQLYTRNEGEFSMYIDAVAKKAGPSSYCNELLMKPYKNAADALEQFKRGWGKRDLS